MTDPAPSRVLLIRPSALGDVCRSVPLLVSLKRAWPTARIDWLVQDTFVDAVRAHPDVHKIVPFARSGLRRWWTAEALGTFKGLVSALRRERYDLVIDAQGLARSGLLAMLTGSARRVGPRDARELGWLSYTRAVDVDSVLAGAGRPSVHTVDRMMALGGSLGASLETDMRLHVPDRDAAACGADGRLSDGPIVVVAPTSRWAGKRWPAERFAKVVGALAARQDLARVVIVGGRDEREQCRPILEATATNPRVVDLIGQTSVGGLMALICRSRLVIANDSAALHMAVGFSRPLVGLFGPTDVRRVGPYGRDADVLQHAEPGQRFDHKDERLGRGLMERISVDEVLAKADTALAAPFSGT